MNLAEVTVALREGVRIARLRGEIDLSNADEISAELEAAADARGADGAGLILELSDVDYLDSAGVRMLFRVARAVSDAGGTVRVVVPRDGQIRRVLELAELTLVVPVEETEDDALARLVAPR